MESEPLIQRNGIFKFKSQIQKRNIISNKLKNSQKKQLDLKKKFDFKNDATLIKNVEGFY